jgi:hypothetical protein
MNRRLLHGALAGIAATAAMTVAMNRMFRALPERERYPLPPRELTEAVAGGPAAAKPSSSAGAAMAAHFAFGAVTGAGFALQDRRDVASGSAFAIGIWGASYLGWIPAAGLLRSATSHPARRNALMLAAHIIWGSTLATVLRELDAAAEEAFAERDRLPEDMSLVQGTPA